MPELIVVIFQCNIVDRILNFSCALKYYLIFQQAKVFVADLVYLVPKKNAIPTFQQQKKCPHRIPGALACMQLKFLQTYWHNFPKAKRDFEMKFVLFLR